MSFLTLRSAERRRAKLAIVALPESTELPWYIGRTHRILPLFTLQQWQPTGLIGIPTNRGDKVQKEVAFDCFHFGRLFSIIAYTRPNVRARHLSFVNIICVSLLLRNCENVMYSNSKDNDNTHCRLQCIPCSNSRTFTRIKFF